MGKGNLMADNSEQLDRIERKLDEEGEKIDGILHWMNGNGQPGVKARLAVIEDQVAATKRVQWLVLGAGVTAVVAALIEII